MKKIVFVFERDKDFEEFKKDLVMDFPEEVGKVEESSDEITITIINGDFDPDASNEPWKPEQHVEIEESN